MVVYSIYTHLHSNGDYRIYTHIAFTTDANAYNSTRALRSKLKLWERRKEALGHTFMPIARNRLTRNNVRFLPGTATYSIRRKVLLQYVNS